MESSLTSCGYNHKSLVCMHTLLLHMSLVCMQECMNHICGYIVRCQCHGDKVVTQVTYMKLVCVTTSDFLYVHEASVCNFLYVHEAIVCNL